MCYETTKNERAKIAQEDILVYKVVKRTKKGVYVGAYRSDYKYTINTVTPKVKIRKIFDGGIFNITKGYHFMVTRQSAEYLKKYSSMWFSHKLSIHKFLIPKGTRYFVNKNSNEGVAEQIIMIK